MLVPLKLPTIGAVQVISSELRPYPQFHSPGFFLYIRKTYFQKHLLFSETLVPVVSFSRIFSIHQEDLFSETLVIQIFLTTMCQEVNLFCFFIKQDVLYFFPTNWLLLIVIDKFANRTSCVYCFRHSGKFPRERLP